jgi:hypothetical protein
MKRLPINESFVIQVANLANKVLEEARQRALSSKAFFMAPSEPTTLCLADVEAVLTALHALEYYTPPLTVAARVGQDVITTDSHHAITIPPGQIRHEGEPVFPELRSRLQDYHRSRLLDLVNAREAYGIAKYGQTLMTDDGRDTPTEIINEMLDMLAYMTKWSMQDPDDFAISYALIKAIAFTADIVDLVRVREP